MSDRFEYFIKPLLTARRNKKTKKTSTQIVVALYSWVLNRSPMHTTHTDSRGTLTDDFRCPHPPGLRGTYNSGSAIRRVSGRTSFLHHRPTRHPLPVRACPWSLEWPPTLTTGDVDLRDDRTLRGPTRWQPVWGVKSLDGPSHRCSQGWHKPL